MMPVFPLKTRRNLQAVIGCAVAMAVFSAAPARAEEDSFEQKAMDSIMGAFGLTRGNQPGIDYRERSPLVVPQSSATMRSRPKAMPPWGGAP